MQKNEETKKLTDDIKQLVASIRQYAPTVGIFGNSGVGKSSLCNALFGAEIAKISHTKACTREPQEIEISNKKIKLVDMPGIGEDIKHHTEYIELYKEWVPKFDIILWLIKADDRNYASALEAHSVIVSQKSVPPIIFVITQIDKMNPIKEWDDTKNEPGKTQQINIADKVEDVSERFSVSSKKIIPISPENKYNLEQLVSLIVEVSPNEKKYSYVREVNEKYRTENIIISAEKGVWEAVKEFAGDAFDKVKDVAVEIVVASVAKLAERGMEWLKGKIFK